MTHPRVLSNFSRQIPDGDNMERDVCDTCGMIAYDNPKIVTGAVVHNGADKFLLCKRAIEPRHGYWTLPAGFLEQNEAVEDGAKREVREEACAEVEIEGLLGIYSVARISQVQLIYQAKLVSDFAPGPESLDVKLFTLDEIPWDQVAFPSVYWGLQHYLEAQATGAIIAKPEPPGNFMDYFGRKPDWLS